MIISHRHRFVFQHCRKAAGSSIAAALAPHLGPDDLHLGTWPEAWRAGVAPNRRARRDLLHPLAAGSFAWRWLRRPARWARREHIVDALNGAQRLRYRRQLGFSPEHAHAADVRRFDRGAWDGYFKFCFVRNPYARAVSDYRWRMGKTGRDDLDFGGFLDAMTRRDFSHPAIPRHWDNWPIYAIDDDVAVDFVGRFEHLAEDLERAFERIGLPAPDLPHAKASGPSTDWRDWYGRRERALVERLFGRELDEFGYGFDS
ncbi:MAG: sulfotransferase family 2 domain-containing protein [Wenzhouxiangellaceae bacterium]|nr:sulfotransferase family 2 domain-containing protein [Wenzhouxiangellaceae bacterium]